MKQALLTRRLGLVAALGAVTAFVACDLNPQPLPPFDPDNRASAGADAGSSGFGGTDGGVNGDPGSNDASLPPELDAGDDADAGLNDAGDAGLDAGDDADADTSS